MIVIPRFSVPVQIDVEFEQNNIPFLAQEIAKVHEGFYAGTEVLIGPGGLMAYLVVKGEPKGHVGFSYNAFLKKALPLVWEKILEHERSVPEAIGL